jgi:nicotinate-nucleotide adenylyltransferase
MPLHLHEHYIISFVNNYFNGSCIGGGIPVMRGIGLLGGTFDPIHKGHVHLAQSVRKMMHLAEIHFLPAARPLLRASPRASEAARVHMVQLVVDTQPYFCLDEREIRRGGNSYMIDTLREIRVEFPDTPLCLIIGVDQFSQFDQWKAWQDIPSVSHIVVTTREGFDCKLNPVIKDFLFVHKTDKVEDLQGEVAGKIFMLSLDTLPISSTQIREGITKGEDVSALLPESVAAFIEREGLYNEWLSTVPNN